MKNILGKDEAIVKLPLVRSAFGYDAVFVSEATGLRCLEETLTVQADKEECDINTLVRRFGIDHLAATNVNVPIQADFVAAVDFKDAQNLMIEADQAFMQMSADVRTKFNHDAGAFVAFASDPANIEEARKLGLTSPEYEAKIKAAADLAASKGDRDGKGSGGEVVGDRGSVASGRDQRPGGGVKAPRSQGDE